MLTFCCDYPCSCLSSCVQVNVRYLICADTVEETILTIARGQLGKAEGGWGSSMLQRVERSSLAISTHILRAFAFLSLCAAAIFASPFAAEKMNQRGANDDGAENSGLALLPELAGSSAASSGKAAAAAAAAPAAPGSDSEEDAPAAGRRGRGRNGRMDRESGRGVTMGHATNDALPDLRLGELERLFAV